MKNNVFTVLVNANSAGTVAIKYWHLQVEKTVYTKVIQMSKNV